MGMGVRDLESPGDELAADAAILLRYVGDLVSTLRMALGNRTQLPQRDRKIKIGIAVCDSLQIGNDKREGKWRAVTDADYIVHTRHGWHQAHTNHP